MPASFAARMLYFLFAFGSFYGDMAIFAGLLGLGVALNRGQLGEIPEQSELED